MPSLRYDAPPYFDDFSEMKNYLKVLFKPGRAVQARELTQLQTILHNQISHTGRHLFKNGTLVAGGTQTFTKDSTAVSYLKLQDLDYYQAPVQLGMIKEGMVVRRLANIGDGRAGTALVAKIVSVSAKNGPDPATLFVVYSNQNKLASKFLSNESLVISDPTVGSASQHVMIVKTENISPDAENVSSGTTSTFHVIGGLYFYDGKYLKASGGHLVLDKYSNTPTYKIGYMVEEYIATSRDDATLLDPAIASSNAGGEGADRQGFRLTLMKHGNGVTIPEQNPAGFFEIARLVNGNVEWQIQEALLSKIGDELARRTFDESGNYIVDFPTMDLSNQSSRTAPSFTGTLSRGLSYVKGYRIESPAGKKVSFSKTRSGVVKENTTRPNSFRNYVFVSDHSALSGFGNEQANGMFAIGNRPTGYDFSDFTSATHSPGEPVEFHSVQCEMIDDTSGSTTTSGANNWNSTLIGTMKPLMMFRDGYETGVRVHPGQTSEAHGFRDAYQLYFADFKPKTITGTSNATSTIVITGGNIESGNRVLQFPAQEHGLAAGEHWIFYLGGGYNGGGFGGSGFNNWRGGYGQILATNTTSITIPLYGATGDMPTDRTAVMHTLGNTAWNGGRITPSINLSRLDVQKEFIILDQANRSPVSEAYVGGTITLTGGVNFYGDALPTATHTATIVRYQGDNDTDAQKPGLLQFSPQIPNWYPTRDTTYSISLGIKQARSVIYNGNKNASGEPQYPGTRNIQWNIDPAGRQPHPPIPGEGDGGQFSNNMRFTKYNDGTQTGPKSMSADTSVLMGTVGGSGIRRVMTHGNISEGLTSNSIIYYIEALSATGGGAATLQFDLPAASNYKFFGNAPGGTQPVLFPYAGVETLQKANMGRVPLDYIKNNFILVNKTTGNVATKFIQTMVITPSAGKIVVTAGFTNGDEYELLAPVRADYVKPARKKKITANVTWSATGATDFANGQIFIPYDSVSLDSAMSLELPDAIKLRKVVRDFDPNVSDGVPDLNDSTKDITAYYNLDTGQRDAFYDNGSIILNDGETAPGLSSTSNLFVCFDYMDRQDYSGSPNANSPSFFSIDSYQYTTKLTLSGGGTPFSVGDLVVGTTSKSSGYVFDYSDAATPTMLLENVNGNFQNGELIKIGNQESSGGETIASVVNADFKYETIPSYTSSKSGISYDLKDMFDYRPYVVNANGNFQTSAIVPISSTHRIRTGVNHAFGITEESRRTLHSRDTFASRIDKVVLHKSGNYKVIRGEPGIVPIPPRDDASGDSMTLFTVRIFPRTETPGLTVIHKNKALIRHTMKDIGRLAQKIENLEYYVSLNALELAASSMTIPDGNGLDRFKNGILVDPFNDRSVIDENNIDTVGRYQIGEGKLRPGVEDFSDHEAFINEAGQVNISKSGHSPGKAVVMLEHGDPVSYITQEQWTEPVSVNPYSLSNYTGFMTLTPDYDRSVSYTQHPQYQLEIPGQVAPIDPVQLVAGTNWEADHEGILSALLGTIDIWSQVCGAGVVRDTSILNGISLMRVNGQPWESPTELNRNIQLTGAGPASTPELDAALAILQGNLQGDVVSLSMLPYVRRKDIILEGRALKPNWNHNAFFDSTYVENYRAKATEAHLQWDTYVPGTDEDGEQNRAFFPMSSIAGEQGDYEKVGLYSSGDVHVANGILLAVRNYHHTDKLEFELYGDDAQEDVKIGYVVPVPDEYVTTLGTPGLNEYFSLLDGYYNPNSAPSIKTFGWNGIGVRYMKGFESGAKVFLKSDQTRSHEWNGHYTGTAAFWADQTSGWTARAADRNVHANTTHLVLSEDAGRYIANNFGIYASGPSATPAGVGYPFRTTINIIGGSGAGQVGFVNAVSRSGDYVVIEWRGNDAGDTVGISSARPLDDTSVYSINMDPCGVNRTHFPTMSQFGGIEYASNKYGEQFSVLHIPNNSRMLFTAGEKLVELKDRASDTPWLVTSYASKPYHAEGAEGVAAFDPTPATRAIQKIRAAALRLARTSSDPFALEFIPATSGGIDGKLAVCTHVTIENPGDPADASYTDNRGPEIFGSVGYLLDAGGS